MHALGEFIQEQMKARGWKQIDLVHASGLAKQVISQLLGGSELRRMIDGDTVTGLATAFGLSGFDGLSEQERAAVLHDHEQIILLKSAEAIGVPVKPVVITVPGEPSDEYVLEIVREALQLRRQLKVDTSESVAAPNLEDATNAVGNKVSGGTATSGDVRDPLRRSRGSDETNGVEQPSAEHSSAEHSGPPHL